MDQKTKKDIEDLINGEYNNVSNLDVKEDGTAYFTLQPRSKVGRFGYDMEDISDLESKDKKIKLTVSDVHLEGDEDDPHRKYLCVEYEIKIEEGMNENWETELNDYIKSDCRHLETKSELTKDDVDDVVTYFSEKYPDSVKGVAPDDLFASAANKLGWKPEDVAESTRGLKYMKMFEQFNEKEAVDVECEEMAAIVYDTLMQNKQHPQFDLKAVRDQEVGGNKITFVYKGLAYNITITSERGEA